MQGDLQTASTVFDHQVFVRPSFKVQGRECRRRLLRAGGTAQTGLMQDHLLLPWSHSNVRVCDQDAMQGVIWVVLERDGC